MQKIEQINQRVLMDNNEQITTSELAHTFNCSTSEICAVLRFMGCSPDPRKAVGAGKSFLWRRFEAVALLKTLCEMRANTSQQRERIITDFISHASRYSNIVEALLSSSSFLIDGDVIVIRPPHNFAFYKMNESRNLDILNNAARQVFKSRVKIVTPRQEP